MVLYTDDFKTRLPEDVIVRVFYAVIDIRTINYDPNSGGYSCGIYYETEEEAKAVMQAMYEAERRGDKAFLIPGQLEI